MVSSSAEEPLPLRTVSRLVMDWVHRLGSIWVDGQITELSPRGATTFLQLRDPAAQVSMSVRVATSLVRAVVPPLGPGSRVVLHARPEYFLARGTISLNATEIRQVGVGELLVRLERLKGILAAEGLFAADRKRRLPFLPAKIGLISSRGSAAERDVLENCGRRWPAVAFVQENVPVQGPHAVAEILPALSRLDRQPEVEVIVIARGGGSVEDLLPFSDEALIRAVAACRTPVVSAIGHEQDTPLLDLVADVRASTPTDAAKCVVPAVADELAHIASLRSRSRATVSRRLDREERWLADVRARPALAAPERQLGMRAAELQSVRDRLRGALGRRVTAAADDLTHVRLRVRALSPHATLERGYAVLLDDRGTALRSVTEVHAGDQASATLADGRLTVTVDAVSAR